mmetsp:Transcript_5873/g.15622  ORF Transcript_5873/g.15622 Transcript_5873/m.15622 type:complete len:219 (-) Transcript_5873:2336-2992(-)
MRCHAAASWRSTCLRLNRCLKMTWYCTSARGGMMRVTGHDKRYDSSSALQPSSSSARGRRRREDGVPALLCALAVDRRCGVPMGVFPAVAVDPRVRAPASRDSSSTDRGSSSTDSSSACGSCATLLVRMASSSSDCKRGRLMSRTGLSSSSRAASAKCTTKSPWSSMKKCLRERSHVIKPTSCSDRNRCSSDADARACAAMMSCTKLLWGSYARRGFC